MATAYSANARLQKPSTSDRNWDVPINANTDTLDGLTAIGGLAVTVTESPSATLRVRVAPGPFIRSDGTPSNYPGTSAFAVAASSTVHLWLTDLGVLSGGPSFPSSAHLRLARVVVGSGSVSEVVDQRVQCSVVGSGLGFVLKTGDTISGPLTVATPGTGTPLVVADAASRLIGFFGAPPASRAPGLTPLASPTGIASDILGDVGASFSQAVLNNNFASLTAKVDALIAAMKRHGLMGS